MSTLAITKSSAVRVASPQGDAHPDWVSDALFPFESRFVEVDGAHLHYVDEGTGPTLLMVHGSPMWSFMYRAVIHELRDCFRCVAVDLPGLGLSKAPLFHGRAFSRNADWLQAFVDRLDLRDMTLIVHATAGPSALEVTLRQAEIVARFLPSVQTQAPADVSTEIEIVNGEPAILAYRNDHLIAVLSFDVFRGRVRNIFVQQDPDKHSGMGPLRFQA